MSIVSLWLYGSKLYECGSYIYSFQLFYCTHFWNTLPTKCLTAELNYCYSPHNELNRKSIAFSVKKFTFKL